jgi:putative ABC transport system permease protein
VFFALALRDVVRQRTRSILTMAAVALGVAGVVVAGGFVEDILHQLRESTIHSQIGHLQIHARGFSEQGEYRPLDYVIDDAPMTEAMLRSVPGVEVVTPRLQFSGLLSNASGDLPVIGEGVEIGGETSLGGAITILEGRALSAGDVGGALVGEGLAKALRLKVGDAVNIVVSAKEGAMNVLDFNVVGIFRTPSKDYDERAVRVPLKAAQDLATTSGVTALVLLLADTDMTSHVQTELERMLAPRRLEVKSWREIADFYNSTDAFYRRQFTVLQIMILVMVLLSVSNTVTMALHERTAEFATMRALGRKSGHVARIAVLETGLIGAIGAIAGIGLGAGFALLVSALQIRMPPPPNSEAAFIAGVRLVPTLIASAFALGTIGAMAASVLPARRIGKMPLAEALRQGD